MKKHSHRWTISLLALGAFVTGTEEFVVSGILFNHCFSFLLLELLHL
ncbi:hypothetical protein KFZ56_02425 [Virgibacillus sp. NKC19-3]|nr:hypothetical protein [Virgibacillus sp. NKC19-3]MBY7141959.1 hypothetical protein [Virgibacillus sp. NKC19-3]